jgi:hypothetical protein
MIQRLFFSCVVASVCAMAGCGDGANLPPVKNTTADGPHGGVTVPLPGNAGFAEIFSGDPAASDSKPAKGREPKAVLVYFLGPDKTSAMTPAPTGASIKIVGGGAGASITLSPSPDPKDPAGSGRFASALGDFDLGGRRAELVLDLDGKQVALEFQGLR